MEKVLIYRHQLFKSSEVFIRQQAEAMTRFKPVYTGRKTVGSHPGKPEVITLSGSKIKLLQNVLLRDCSTLAQKAKQYDPKLVHAHFGVEGVYALDLAKRLRIPLVTTFHGYDATTTTHNLLASGKPAWLNYALFRGKLASQGNLFICVSEYIRQRVLALGFPEDRTVKHYMGIDLANIQPKYEKGSSPIILHVARLVEKKGTRYLIEAFNYIAPKYKDAQLIIIGEGPLRPELEKLQQELGLGSKITFLGVQPHSVVLEWMAKASVFCMPSVTASSGDSEGLGMVLLEAAAMEVPVVATLHGGIPEAVEDGITGYLVEERNSQDLAERLGFLLEQGSKREQMGKAARRMVEERFDIKCQTQKLEDMYEKLL